MKKLFILSLLYVFGISQVSAFSDIEHNWYRESVLELKNQWVINGFDDGTYAPSENTTRAELLKILLNSAEVELKTDWGESCFSDVSTDIWYAKYICTAEELGMAKWYDDKTFAPQGKLTVLEALTFASRVFDLKLRESAEWEEWFQRYREFAHEEKIIPQNSYTLDTLVTRGQVADIIFKVQQYSRWEDISYESLGCSVNDLKSWSYTINVNGSKREYLLYVPSSFFNKELWLIVAFHGRTNSNSQVRDYMVLWGGSYGGTKNQKDYIVAYPAGIWPGPRSWGEPENIDFFDVLTRHIADNACISRDKVFSVGHSLGSYMSNKVTCLRGDVIRGMVGVASDGYDWDCTGPASSLIMHLQDDHLASYIWGKRAYRIRTEVNSCEDTTEKVTIDGNSCEKKTSCSQGNSVVFCNSYTTYQNDPHSWPKSGGDMIFDYLDNIESY